MCDPSPDETPSICSDLKNPIEIYSTVDVALNETSFLTFQLDQHTCSKNTSNPLPKNSPWNLEYSVDYGQIWASVDRPSTAISSPNDIIIRQPLPSIKHNNTFGLPLYAYLPAAKYSFRFPSFSLVRSFRCIHRSLRIRWLAPNAAVANLWRIRNVTIRPECDLICQMDPCQSKCSCPKTNSCATTTSKKRTFLQKFDQNSSSIAETIVLPPLNLVATR